MKTRAAPAARPFGVELECFNASHNRTRVELEKRGLKVRPPNSRVRTKFDRWIMTGDPSIRGEMALELVSPIMQSYEQIEPACDALRAVGAKTNASCGLHVHVESRPLSIKQIQRLFILYAVYESAFDAFVDLSRQRHGNTFCQSLRTQIAARRHIDVQQLTVGQVIRHVTQLNSVVNLCETFGGHYGKLSPQPMTKYGTVEWRHHHATLDHSRIEAWVQLIQGVYAFARTDKLITTPDNGFCSDVDALFDLIEPAFELDAKPRMLTKMRNPTGPTAQCWAYLDDGHGRDRLIQWAEEKGIKRDTASRAFRKWMDRKVELHQAMIAKAAKMREPDKGSHIRTQREPASEMVRTAPVPPPEEAPRRVTRSTLDELARIDSTARAEMEDLLNRERELNQEMELERRRIYNARTTNTSTATVVEWNPGDAPQWSHMVSRPTPTPPRDPRASAEVVRDIWRRISSSSQNSADANS